MIEPSSGPDGVINAPRSQPQGMPPWTVACLTLLITLVGFVIVGPFIGLTIAFPFYDGKPMDFVADLSNPIGKESMKMIYLAVQGCTTFFGLAVIPALAWRAMTHRPIFGLFKSTQLKPVHFLIVAGIVFFYLGFISKLTEWNANIDLPDGGFEDFAKTMEQQLSEVTKYLTNYTGFGQYLAGVFVIAVLAGFGEELVFRGLLQPELHRATGNIHFAIWTSAFFFSAMHMQFYGFIPRIFLGALFGYLYYWSGSLTLSMFAHFFNNFIAVTSIYFGLNELPGIDTTEKPESTPWYVVVLMTVVCVALIYLFQKQFKKTDDIRA
ncbi:MAG TPA: CPBP family intramembrane glutamic endopeptidase [Cyclobacteriaceae bacterium]